MFEIVCIVSKNFCIEPSFLVSLCNFLPSLSITFAASKSLSFSSLQHSQCQLLIFNLSNLLSNPSSGGENPEYRQTKDVFWNLSIFFEIHVISIFFTTVATRFDVVCLPHIACHHE